LELLVVVLIIGILTGIALPQYKKTVKRTRMTQLSNMVSTFGRAIDVYLLDHDWPADATYFCGDGSGNYNYGSLDIDFKGERYTQTNTKDKFGSWNTVCTTSYCDICVNTSDGTGNGKWLGEKTICIKKFKDKNNGQWVLGYLGGGTSSDENEQLICQWWRDHYGTDKMTSGIKKKCANVGIE